MSITNQFNKAIAFFAYPLVFEGLSLANFRGLRANLFQQLLWGDRCTLTLRWTRRPYSGLMRALESNLRTLLREDMGNRLLCSVCDHLQRL